jgi:hypothetical protein
VWFLELTFWRYVEGISELGTTLAVTDNYVTPCGSFNNGRVSSNVVPSPLTFYTVMMEAIPSSKISLITGATPHNIPEDGILLSHRFENLKSYIELTCWAL